MLTFASSMTIHVYTRPADMRKGLDGLSDKETELRDKEDELQRHRGQLRQQDIDLQTKQLTIDKLERENQEWELAYNQLLQRAFGRRSERYIDNPDQLRLDFGDTDAAADAAAGLADAIEDQQQTIPEHQRRRPRKKRDESLPAHLPRYEVTAEIDDAQKTCPVHGPRTVLPESMWDRTETLEFERPKLRVRVTIYPKYACPDEPQCGIASPERPTGLVEGNKYDSSIAAEIITGKYSYHLPLYRLQDYFAGSGWLAEAAERTSNVILPKSDLGKALQYIGNHFDPLRRYLQDPRLPIENNETEQLMKQVAIGRKNWLFAGSVAGGERTAGFLTLTSSALRNDLDVWQYVKDVLDQLLAGVTDYEPLLPWNWAASHPDAIRQYRVVERRDRAQRTRLRRAGRRRSLAKR